MNMTADSNAIERLSARAIELLASLVAFDSVSHRSNLPLLRSIRDYLHDHHIDCFFVPSPDGEKSNLLARIGPDIAGGIVLSGHTDVVPVEGQSWDTHPFQLTERDGKIYGRGTSDMKSFLACCLAMTPEFARTALKRPIYLAFSYDEEVGCLGAPYLLEHIGKHVPKPRFAIIGEPTQMQVVTAHKGVLSFETVVHGLEWHSSQPHYGVNAVQAACDLVQFLTGMADELAKAGKRDERFDPPHSTVHVGVIHGGTARNIIPKECRFLWEIRPLPGDDADAIFARFANYAAKKQAELEARSPLAGITTQPRSRMTGVTLPPDANEARELVMRCAQTNQEHAVAFGTEAGVFNDNGIPAIICGPGSIEQAHKPNEFIEASQIRECIGFLLRLRDQLAS